ncbi:hypothetical protein ACGC1H_006182 [Rhizoctonia solani]
MAEQVGLEMTSSVNQLCTELEAEVTRVEKRLERNTVQQLVEAMDVSEDISECYRRIQTHLERLTLNTTMNVLKRLNNQNEAIERQTKVFNKQEMELRLKGMSPALSAIYNSAESDDIGRGGCTPGTREAPIDLLLEWARDRAAGKTCWVNGMAGTGKTTIAYSVCSQLNESFGLGASFFCSRVISECRQVKHIIPSISYQLARFSFPFRCVLDKVLEADPDAHTRALKLQYDKLILGPLSTVQGSLPTDFIVAIDALDECENENSLGQVLDLLLSTPKTLPIRFLVSSRPEPEIYRRMMSDAKLVLHDLAEDAVKSDIENYMRHELANIPLTDTQWSGLIKQCGVLFIYASTACRLIKQGYEMATLDEAVGMIMNPLGTSTNEDEIIIDDLYFTILTTAFNKAKMSRANRQRMRDLLETVLCAIEPMSLDVLAGVLELKDVEQANALLQPLRSVLNVKFTGLVTSLHTSFPDFMFSSSRSTGFHCIATSRHTALAERCLRMLQGVEPKFNICRFPSSFLLDHEVENIDKRVNLAISPSLIYACRYWSAHLYLGESRQELVAAVREFFSERLLLWMEMLNLTRQMRFGTSVIRDAEKWCQVCCRIYNKAL